MNVDNSGRESPTSSSRSDNPEKAEKKISMWARILPLLRKSQSGDTTRPKTKYCGIHVASPKYNEFALKYLDSQGKIRSEISNVILSRPHVKGISVSYDTVNRRWGFDVYVGGSAFAKVVFMDSKLSAYPCRIVISDN